MVHRGDEEKRAKIYPHSQSLHSRIGLQARDADVNFRTNQGTEAKPEPEQINLHTSWTTCHQEGESMSFVIFAQQHGSTCCTICLSSKPRATQSWKSKTNSPRCTPHTWRFSRERTCWGWKLRRKRFDRRAQWAPCSSGIRSTIGLRKKARHPKPHSSHDRHINWYDG